MPLALLLVSLSLLHGCIMPALSHAIANAPPSLLEATKSLASSSFVCDNLSNCRSLHSIIASCLTTIAACILVAVHPDIPGPTEIPWLLKMFGTRNVGAVLLLTLFESFKLFIAALLVPEWYLALAVQQVLRARYCAGKLEEARIKAAIGAADKAITRQQARYCAGTPEEEKAKAAAVQLVELEKLGSELLRNDRSWTITHAFFTNMGGFQFYRHGEPPFPLVYEDVLELVKSHSLVPPTLDELRDNSKGDSLSKSIAVSQALWFVVQCIARRIENRAITNLEIMTLAYTVITLAMYAAWWNKPLNVRYPIRVLVRGNKETVSVKVMPTSKRPGIVGYVRRNEDRLVNLLRLEGSFLSGIIGLAIAIISGAIHCAAWSFAYPSLAEQQAWRVCAIAIVAIPLALTVVFAVFMVFNPDPPIPTKESSHSAYTYHIPLICMALCALLYIPARIFLLGLSFSTLRHLPLSSYQTIQWTTFIPHI